MAERKTTAERKKLFESISGGSSTKMKKVNTQVHDGMARSKTLATVKKGTKLRETKKPNTDLPQHQKVAFRKARAEAKGQSFVEKLDKEGLAFFNEVAAKPFSEQAVAFLNAYWGEVGNQAEFIYSVAWDKFKYADMHARGINYVHRYKQGCHLEFDIGLYFYEQLCKFLDETKEGWKSEQYAPSLPEMMTAIKRKKELRDKVDVNFDGKVSMLEYLLYQYRAFANPADFVTRAMNHDEHPEIRKARLALEKVNEKIAAYEAEKQRLTTNAKKPGVPGLRAKNLLAQLDASPLWEALQKALITAEAAVRIATRKFGGKAYKAGKSEGGSGKAIGRDEGSIWWLNRDLAEKKKKYGRK